MRVLIACEFSGIVRDAFNEHGHDALSCDLLPTERPGNHYKGDVRDLLKEYFDLVIFHPECTYITNSGVRWLKHSTGFDYERMKRLQNATAFFNLRHHFNSPKVATENPIPHKYAVNDGYGVVGIGKYNQIIHPWQYGHGEQKTTCLWLKNLPKLTPTNIVEGREQKIWRMPPSETRGKDRSRTYEGIAKAMAEQWGELLKQKVA